jgi:hypothetical protein
MFRFNRKAIAAIGASCSAFIATTAHAINAVFIAGPIPFGPFTDGKIEVQGFNGRFDFPTQIQGPPETSATATDTAVGATATDNVLYTLLSSPVQSASVITESDTHTGAYLGTIQLPSTFTDIAYTNGQLYGVQSVTASNHTQSLQIASIAANGSVQPLLTQSTSSSSSTNWRLSGAVNGDSLLISPPLIINSPSAETFIPSTPSTPPSTFNLPFGANVNDTVIHADGAAVTTIGGQVDYSYPGAILIGPRSLSTSYGGGHQNTPISDEFNYTYTSSQPAYASLSGSPNNLFTGSHDALYRLPQTLTGTQTIFLQNGVTPDGTTINNVIASGLVQQDQGAPLPITIQETDAPPGPFAFRQIAQANISVNLAGASRGFYGIGTNSNLTADYTTGAITQTGQPVSVSTSDFAEFAYDPASANLVGNGDGSIAAFGWETVDGKTGDIDHAFAPSSDLGFGIVPFSGDPQSLTQILELPTSNSPMELSFSYDDFSSGPADLTVSLNGIVLGDVSVTSKTPTTFQTIINNPSLENLANANLTFTATAIGTNASSWVGVGSITLEAVVPEPASASLLGLAAMTVLTRRRRR